MSGSKNTPQKKPMDVASSRPSIKSSLDALIPSLTDEQRQSLAQKALESQLELGVKAEEARLRFENSSDDMDRTIQTLRGLENSTTSDYELTARSQTASGQIDLKITKSNNMAVIVIAVAIVVGVVSLLILAK